jgi:Ca2+-binding EF-hand superfamily protein
MDSAQWSKESSHNSIDEQLSDEQLLNRATLMQVFQEMDGDGDGYIDLEDLKAVVAEYHDDAQSVTDQQMQAWLQSAGSTGQTKISFGVFQSVMMLEEELEEAVEAS